MNEKEKDMPAAKKDADKAPETTPEETPEEVTPEETPEDEPSQPTGSGTVHQDGAPEALVEAVETSEKLGYVAPEQNALKPEKPDYSQANPAVMNKG